MFEIKPRLTFFTDQYIYHLRVIFTIFNQKPCNISIPYGIIFVCFQSKVLQHTHTTWVLFLSVFNQKSCNINIPLWCYFSLFSIKSPATYTYHLGVIFVCFQPKVVQVHIPPKFGIFRSRAAAGRPRIRIFLKGHQNGQRTKF